MVHHFHEHKALDGSSIESQDTLNIETITRCDDIIGIDEPLDQLGSIQPLVGAD